MRCVTLDPTEIISTEGSIIWLLKKSVSLTCVQRDRNVHVSVKNKYTGDSHHLIGPRLFALNHATQKKLNEAQNQRHTVSSKRVHSRLN